MAAFIHLPCPCGKTIRAREDQSGTTVRCWGCGREVAVPRPKDAGRIAGAFARTTGDALRSEVLFLALAMAVVPALLLCVPHAGRWLGLAFALLAAVIYQDTIRSAGEGPVGEPVGLASLFRPWWPLRWALGAVGVALFLAPLLYRHWGFLVPGRRSFAGEQALLTASFLGWVLAPLILMVANARDGAGRLGPGRALALLASHPAATAAALLVAPLAFWVVEFAVVMTAWYESLLALFVNDLLPVPEPAPTVGPGDGRRLVFYTDLYDYNRLASIMTVRGLPDYIKALYRGFFLTATIPASLPVGIHTRAEPEIFLLGAYTYLAWRFVYSVIIFTAMGLALALQATWLGLIAAVGSKRISYTHAPPAEVVGATNSAATEADRPEERPATALDPEGLPVVLAEVSRRSLSRPSGPASPGPAALAATPAEGVPGSNGTGIASFVAGRPTVLIIDDERSFAHAIGKILADRGFAVVVAGDGEEGIRQARACRPDVIILDLLLPDRLGMDVCKDLKAHPTTRHIPVVVSTHKNGPDDELAALSQGADDYLGKPYMIDLLIVRIEKQLGRRGFGPTQRVAPGPH